MPAIAAFAGDVVIAGSSSVTVPVTWSPSEFAPRTSTSIVPSSFFAVTVPVSVIVS